jgi:hypothetical protein
MEPLGKVAYDACRQYLASKPGHEGEPGVPAEEWEDLPPVYREAWEAAAQAVSAKVQP